MAGITVHKATPSATLFQFSVVPILLFMSFSLIPQVRDNPVLFWTFIGAGALLFGWTALLMRKGEQSFSYDLNIRSQHWVQGLVQICIYVYWGMYWPSVYDFAILIVAQLLFGYLFDMLLSWTKGEKWSLGFGLFPIILSTNLFMWFRPDWFYFQFLLIAVGLMGKHFILWNKDGRRVHIFNPSAFSLALCSIVLLVTGKSDITWAEEIAVTLFYPDYIYVQIFLLGLIVQYLFSVTLVTLFAAAILYGMSLVYTAQTGYLWFGDTVIPAAVFLGLHLLVTDPSTSPKTTLGRVIFGLLYGLAVWVSFGLLEKLGEPTYYDKLLIVPILNLCVQWLDRIPNLVGFGATATQSSVPHRNWHNLAFMGVWSILFATMFLQGDTLAGQKTQDEASLAKQACLAGDTNSCQRYSDQLNTYCFHGNRHRSCMELGEVLSNGEFVPAEPVRALRSFYRACALGFQAACEQRMEKLCDQASVHACEGLARIYEEGTVLQQNLPKAARYRAKACALGSESACAEAQ